MSFQELQKEPRYLSLSLSMSALPPYLPAGWYEVTELTLYLILDKRRYYLTIDLLPCQYMHAHIFMHFHILPKSLINGKQTV